MSEQIAANHESIGDLYRKLHNQELLIDQMHARLERLEAERNQRRENEDFADSVGLGQR